MKDTRIKETVAKGLANILLSLRISKPSHKTKSYLKKITKKLAKQLKSDTKKLLKKNTNGKSVAAQRTKRKVASKTPVKTARKKK